MEIREAGHKKVVGANGGGEEVQLAVRVFSLKIIHLQYMSYR